MLLRHCEWRHNAGWSPTCPVRNDRICGTSPYHLRRFNTIAFSGEVSKARTKRQHSHLIWDLHDCMGLVRISCLTPLLHSQGRRLQCICGLHSAIPRPLFSSRSRTINPWRNGRAPYAARRALLYLPFCACHGSYTTVGTLHHGFSWPCLSSINIDKFLAGDGRSPWKQVAPLHLQFQRHYQRHLKPFLINSLPLLQFSLRLTIAPSTQPTMMRSLGALGLLPLVLSLPAPQYVPNHSDSSSSRRYPSNPLLHC